MSETRRIRITNGGRPDGRRRQGRRVSLRSVRRELPVVRKLGRAITRLAALEADAERGAQNQVADNGPAGRLVQDAHDTEVDHDQ